ncbi:MAG: glycosyltransferase, partial [Dehalococcoidia bacterium]
LCLGRLVERKAQGLLLEAIASVANEGIEIEVTLAGDGPERGRLERRAAELGIEDQVRFTGVVGQDEALTLYRECDIFCLPSRSEGLPAVLIEAMACGIPVVATRIDAVPELVEDGVSGLLVPPRDATGLASALRRLHDEPQLGQRLGSAGREKVRREFDVATNAAALARRFTRVEAA